MRQVLPARGATVVIGVIGLALAACSVAAPAMADSGLEPWGFMIGEWDFTEKRYSFEGELIQTNPGDAHFTYVMDGARMQEIVTTSRGEQGETALHLFVYNPRKDEVEIARTDSGHYGFWVIVGKMSGDRIELAAKYPNPDSDITRRIIYQRIDDNHFKRQLEFSEDKGETWFVRSEWEYKRK